MSEQMTVCDRCGTALRPGAKFCPACGAPQGQAAESAGQSPAAGYGGEPGLSGAPRDPMQDYSFPVEQTPASSAAGFDAPGMADRPTEPDRPAEMDYNFPLGSAGTPGSGQPQGSPFDLPPAEGAPGGGFSLPGSDLPSGPDVFSAPPVSTGGRSGPLAGRLPLVIGCCAGLLILGCLLAFGLSGWVMDFLGSL